MKNIGVHQACTTTCKVNIWGVQNVMEISLAGEKSIGPILPIFIQCLANIANTYPMVGKYLPNG